MTTTRRSDCPYCEIDRSFVAWQTDPDSWAGECENCGFTGECAHCGETITDDQAGFTDDPRFCSEECITMTTLERAGDAAYDAWKESR